MEEKEAMANDDPQYLKDKIKELVRVLNPLMDIAKKREGACLYPSESRRESHVVCEHALLIASIRHAHSLCLPWWRLWKMANSCMLANRHGRRSRGLA